MFTAFLKHSLRSCLSASVVTPRWPEALHCDHHLPRRVLRERLLWRAGSLACSSLWFVPCVCIPAIPGTAAPIPPALNKYLLESICCNLLHTSTLTMLNILASQLENNTTVFLKEEAYFQMTRVSFF